MHISTHGPSAGSQISSTDVDQVAGQPTTSSANSSRHVDISGLGMPPGQTMTNPKGLGLAEPSLTAVQVQSELSGAMDALKSLEGSAEMDVYALMSLFQKVSQDQRNAARQERAASLGAQESSLRDAAEQIIKAAEDRFQGALAAGLSQIFGGALSVGMGAAAIHQGIAGAAKANEAAKLEIKGTTLNANKMGTGNQLLEQAEDLKTLASNHNAWAGALPTMGQGMSGMVGGIGSVTQANFERSAAEHDAQRARLEADAKVAEQGVQQANEIMQQMLQVIQDIRDKLGTVQQSRTESTRGIARNI